MDAKDIITNKSFCVLPLTGFELEPNGDVKNCIISKNELGNINNTNIENIMSGPENLKLKNFDFRICVEIPIKAKLQNMNYTCLPSYEISRICGKKKVNVLQHFCR